jgi:hypothetical protein
VCTSQFAPPERRAIQELIAMVSGLRAAAYTDTLSSGVTHLIARVAEGDKVACARKAGIPVVSYHWLVESIRAGAPLDESYFPVD